MIYNPALLLYTLPKDAVYGVVSKHKAKLKEEYLTPAERVLYYDAADKATQQKSDRSALDAAYESALKLWSRALDRWAALIEQGQGHAAYIEKCETNEDILRHFATFSKSFAPLGVLAGGPLKLLVGEGNTILNLGKMLRSNLNINEVWFTCGPIMVRSDYQGSGEIPDVERFNDAVTALIKEKDRIKVNIGVNAYISYFSGFAGYFHAYIFEDCAFFETVHNFSSENKNSFFFIHDAEMVKEIDRHLDSYCQSFTFEIDPNNVNGMLDYLNTFDREAYTMLFNNNFLKGIR